MAQLGTPVNAQLDLRGRLNSLESDTLATTPQADVKQLYYYWSPSPSTTGREERTKPRQNLEEDREKWGKQNTLTETEFFSTYSSTAKPSQSGTLTKNYNRTSFTKLNIPTWGNIKPQP
jgi:hypothetical protein